MFLNKNYKIDGTGSSFINFPLHIIISLLTWLPWVSLGNADTGEKGSANKCSPRTQRMEHSYLEFKRGLGLGTEEPWAQPTHSLPEPGRDVWNRFLRNLPGQVEKAQHSGFSPPVCPNQLKSASRNGLGFFKKKKNPSGEVGNLARKLGGEGLGVKVSLTREHLWGQARLGLFASTTSRLTYSRSVVSHLLKRLCKSLGVPKPLPVFGCLVF